MTLASWKKVYKTMEKEFLEKYLTFLRFPSISADPEYLGPSRKCAEWISLLLKEIGFQTQLWETGANPVVFASYDSRQNKPTLLIYHHYDVQPVDPLELWTTPPFEPSFRDQQVFARGAQDNKGQCLYTLMALTALYREKREYPLNIKLCIEGEEEIGSSGLAKMIEKKKKDLKADYLAVVDSGMNQKDHPQIALGARGIITMDVIARGSKEDLHSGSHGGIVYNPLHALVEILAKLRDPKTGKVTVPDFYREVIQMPEGEKSLFRFDFNEELYLQQTEAKPTGGEKEFPPMERGSIRPTLEINGIHGGYGGKGFKTVIPAQAIAKISCRLVPDQDPEIVGKRVADFICSLAPPGIDIEVLLHEGFGKASRAKPGSLLVKAFQQAYSEIFNITPATSLMGGSVPITSALAKACGADMVLVGMGLPTDSIHAPNEHFSLDRIEKGFYSIARAVEILATLR